MSEKEFSPRWTSDILRRCTPRELLVVVAEYGVLAVARRMGYTDIEQFITEKGLRVESKQV